MLSLACSTETTWSSIDIASAFLNADIHNDDTVLATPPPILVKMDMVKPNTVWHVKEAIYGLQEGPRLWQKERDQKLRDLEFMYKDMLTLFNATFIQAFGWLQKAREFPVKIPPFDRSLRSDEWAARLHNHQILGYVGVYVDDLLIAGPRSLNDSLIKAVRQVWKTSTPQHLGPDRDCVPVLRFLGMNLEQVDVDRSAELELLNQMEYINIIEVLMKFGPSLQLKVRTTPGNQESFATRNATLFSTDEAIQEYLQSLQVLVQDEIIWGWQS